MTICASWFPPAHLDRPIHEEPHVPFDALEGATDGLIALTAGGEGALARLFADGQADKAGTYAGPAEGAVPRPALHRTVAPRRRGRGGGRERG